VSIAKRRHLQEQVNPLVQLALADLLAAVTLMFTSAMNETHTFTPSVLICETLLPLSLMFYFVSFLLVVVYAWESKHAVEGWRERPREEEVRTQPSTKGSYTRTHAHTHTHTTLFDLF
ncbi:unnamed protein product, partial [Coregonus sp. 'balchen']